MGHRRRPRSSPSRFITLIVLAAFCSAAAPSEAARPAAAGQPTTQPSELSPPRRPNVLFLLGDDWRWDTLGCAGNPVVKTPRLDALAADGVRFTRAQVTTSICCVSRASILTGQYMSRHGVRDFKTSLSAQAFDQTYTARLREAGYWTGFVGKYGVGRAPADGFDFFRAYEGVHWMKDRAGGKVHVTEKNARDALEFLRARPADRPFCLSVSFFAAHAEDAAPEQYLPQLWSERLYDGVDVPVLPTATDEHFRRLPPFLQTDRNEARVRWAKRFDTAEKYQRYMKNYYRLVTEADEAVGRIVDELKREGAYDETLIVFTGDNGYFHGEHGLADKWFPYDEALRVPLIVRDRRVPAGRRGTTVDAVALNIDICPTMLAAAGVAVPDVVQGRDLAPLYVDATLASPRRQRQWLKEFYYEHPVILGKDRIPASEAVVRRGLKYVYWPDFDFHELYDLKEDPHETRNLASEPAEAQRMERMRHRMEEWRVRAR